MVDARRSNACDGKGEIWKSTNQLHKKELVAIEAVKVAIKALPRTLQISVDDSEGVVDFWKAHNSGGAHGVGTPLRCKAAFNISYRR
jgi:hypothetical protein